MSNFDPNQPLPMCETGKQPLQMALRHFYATEYLELIKIDCTAAGRALCKFLVANGIKMIASDFDLTMTSVHSGGAVAAAAENPILTSLSPDFDQWAECASSMGMRICVVTFSDKKFIPPHINNGLAGRDLVIATLLMSKARFPVEEVYPFYPNFYAEKSEYELLNLKEPMHKSKRFHLRKVCHDFQLNPWEVLLLDDTKENCTVAVEDGFLVLCVHGKKGFSYSKIVPA